MIGQTISHYRILEKLGEGGMGVVYRAEDLKLKRIVALKFLPAGFQKQEAEQARFLQEAEAAAKLSHPNICTIHDICDYQDTATGETQQFIVMEFVDGMTLREKMRNLDRKHAIEVGIQIAEGLGAAHEHGVVHRDIKPENIMVRRDGIVQIMDFGLARLKGVTRITKEGSTAGTAGYMSPEQVQGQDSDHRSDIFSLGVLLYELFTGELPFRGAHETALLYEIVNVDPPPMSSIKPDIEPELDRIVLECLQKEPDERYQAAKDICKDLKRFKRDSTRQHISRVSTTRPVLAPGPGGAREQTFSARTKRDPLAWLVALVMFALAAILGLSQILHRSEPGRVVRAQILPPDSVQFHSYGALAGPATISPDGRRIAFVGVRANGVLILYVRELDGDRARPLPGTEWAYYPFWSPDSRFIAFFANGKLKKVDVAGGSTATICDAFDSKGGSWGADGTILFSPGWLAPLLRVASDGGTPAAATHLDSARVQTSHRWPYFLPDGKHFLYLVRVSSPTGEAEGDAIHVASLDGSFDKALLNASANSACGSGHILFMRGSTLLAQPFNEKTLELEKEAVPIAEGLVNDPGFSLAAFSVSNNGVLAYHVGTARSGARMLVLDRNGRETGSIGEVSEQGYARFSPDGRQLSFYYFDTRRRVANIWLYDFTGRTRSPFTSGVGGMSASIWSPDGKSLVYAHGAGEGAFNLWRKAVGETQKETLLLASPRWKVPLDWSQDGRYVLFGSDGGERTNLDVWVLPLSDLQKPFPFLNTEYIEENARFSPDGRWVAYDTDEPGSNEVYVRPFPGPGAASRISTAGGYLPHWTSGGRQIVYVRDDNRVIAADLRFRGSSVEVASSREMFTMPTFLQEYDISADGGRFVVGRWKESGESTPVTLVLNWTELVRRK